MEGSGLQWSFSSNKPGGGSSQILSFRSSQDNGHGQQQTLYPLALSQQRKSPAVENARAAAGYKTNNSNKHQYNNNSKLQQSRELKKCSSMPGLQRFSSSSTPPPPHHIYGHSFLKQQHPSAITPASNYKASAIVGSTDLSSDDFSSSSSRRGPSQMTIFYNGLVCVYDDVSPEKAQAIMLLAGNGKPTTPPPRSSPTQQVIDLTTRIPTTTTPTHSYPGKGSAPPMSSSVLIPTSVCRSTTSSGVQQQQQQVIKRSSSQLNITPDCIVLNSSPNPLLSVQPIIPTSSSSKTSTSTIISQLVKQPDHQPSSMVVRPLASFATANSPVPGASRAVVESTDPPPPSATANGNGGQLNFQQSAGLPQARNASLHRFLEKRKERVLSVAPYTTTNSKKGNNSDKSENVKGDHHQPTVRRAISQAETTMTPR